jgi:hypothetical protein
MTRAVKSAFALLLVLCAPWARAVDVDQRAFLEAVRARLAALPVLETGAEPGSPNFKVIRFNAPPIIVNGERYGAVRVTCPPDKPMSLAWLFADTTNIAEYGLVSHDGMRLESVFTRVIHPATASADLEQEKPGRRASSLPRPWDLFQLHALGVSARVLKPGGEYIIWFQFSDQRPTDILMAATFVDPNAKLEGEDLSGIFALPALEAR